MDLQRKNLIEKATATYKKIYPCGTTGSFSECFTVYKNHLLFWFDTEDHSTHVEVGELNPYVSS